MGKRNNKRRKKETVEDCCFVCKDGGKMRICDSKNCYKVYHAECVKQDASFMTDNSNWCCGAHYCHLCSRVSKFMCLFCPRAVCEKCFPVAKFATVKRNKGFCRHCAKLIEKNADVDLEGESVVMKDPDACESYVLDYYESIIKKERLNGMKKQKLESPSEQSRSLSEIPEVIPEMVDTNLSSENSSRKDNLEQNDLPELAIGVTYNSVEQYSTHDGFAQCLEKRTDVLGPKIHNQDDTSFPAAAEQLSVHTASQDKDTSPKNLVQCALRSRNHIKPALLEESNSDCQTLNPAKSGLPQLSKTISADVDCRNLSASMDANQAVKEWQIVTVAETVVLSDSDDEDVNIKVTSAGRKGLETESPDINIWYCSGIFGSGKRGPFSMSALKLWSESDFSSSSPFELKVWKTGKSEREAMPLRDALKLFFPECESKSK